MVSRMLRVSSGLVLLSCWGCGEPVASPTTENVPAATSPVENVRATSFLSDGSSLPESYRADDHAILVEVKSWDEAQRWIAEQRGKVIVVDLWSSWCVPCVREFPQLVKLAQEHAGDVVCLGFNLDYSGAVGETPESFLDPIRQFLTKQAAAFPNLISSDPADEVFQRLELGSIPAVLVYDRQGQLSKRFDNDDNLYGDEGFTYEEHVRPWIRQLLGEDF
jgi:thiol-disulfide isomerase/thioredoxin